MAGIKISSLPAIPSSALTDIGPFSQAGATYKATLSQIATLFNANLVLASTAQVTGLPASLASFLPLLGGTMTGSVNMGGNFIQNLADPLNPQDAATKAYADIVGSGFTVILATYAATTANLNATQAGAGVGATLTNAGAQAAFAVDGVSPPVNSRILVKDQTLTQHNGIYTLTTVGSGVSNWVLTRATDYDQAAEIQPGTLIAVNNGTAGANTSWLETATVVTVDTDPVLFSQFTFAPSAFFLIANNLSEGVPATMRNNLGLGDVATKTASDVAQATVSMVNGATAIGNVAVFSDITGTISDGGAFPAASSSNSFVNGRITLTSGTPVTTTNVTAATTVYFSPYRGNSVSLFNGATWDTIEFIQTSIAVPATASTMYDLYAFNNAGTLALETQVWTNDTTRAVVLVLQDGVYVKNGALTRRYLGSFRTTTVAGQTEDSVSKRYIWNYYNRVQRNMQVREATVSWTYSVAAYRQSNANAANQLDMVIGVSEDAVKCHTISIAGNSSLTARLMSTGIGLDSTTVNTAILQESSGSNGGVFVHMSADYNLPVAAGRHTLVWLEKGAGAETQTWQGTNGSTYTQTGIIGEILG